MEKVKRGHKKTNGFNTRRKRRWARRWSQMISCHPERQSTAPQGREEERVNPSVKAYRSPAERRRRSQTNEFVSAQQWRLGCKRADNSVLWAKICHMRGILTSTRKVFDAKDLCFTFFFLTWFMPACSHLNFFWFCVSKILCVCKIVLYKVIQFLFNSSS